MTHLVKPLVSLVHDYLTIAVNPGDLVVDATCGNGIDTVILGKLVGENGRVFAFDMQSSAITETRKVLLHEKILNRVTLLHDNYKEIAKYVPQGISAIVFNLGYLPKGDHTIVSNPIDTVFAIKESMSLLKSGGRLFISVYWGHENGLKEKIAIDDLIREPQYKSWGIFQISVPNREKAPYLLILEKP